MDQCYQQKRLANPWKSQSCTFCCRY